MRSALRLMATAAFALTTLAAPVAPAHASDGIGWFTYSNSSCTTIADPLNVAFTGPQASFVGVEFWVSQVLSWTQKPFNWSGSPQWARAGGGCHQQDGQYNKGFWNKHHVRLFKGRSVAPDHGNDYIAGDAHRDHKSAYCRKGNHPMDDYVPARIKGMSGIDLGAYEIYKKMQDRPFSPDTSIAVTRYQGAKRTFLQCNGTRKVTWNGQRYVFILR